MYDRVLELVLAITNASQASDVALHDSLCLTLREYYEDKARTGGAHPFLTETMADYTGDTAETMRLYELSLEQARVLPNEPTHTKMISLAEKLIQVGRNEQAAAFLRDGRAEAARRGDKFWIEEADRLLHQSAV